MKGKVIGFLTIITVAAFIATASITYLSQEFFKAFNAQLSLFLFVGSVVMTGIYLLKNHTVKKKSSHNLIVLLGLLVWMQGGLVVFDIIPIRSTFHWLFVSGILYVMLVELQVLNWGKGQRVIPKIMSFLVIITSLFLITFYITQWKYAGLQFWITIAMLVNLAACVFGSFFIRLKSIEHVDTPT
jgi:hypothetical protein